MALSKRLRYEILRRDNHACRYCGATAPEAKITVDHVTPIALGGTDDATNLVAACSACNSGKAAVNPDAPLVADVAAQALRWRQALELATSLATRDRERIDAQVRGILDMWPTRWQEAGYREPPADPPVDATATLSDLIARGLDWLIAIDMIGVAVAKHDRDRHFPDAAVWAYFIGCCRKKVAEVETAARRLIDEGHV